MDDKKKPEQPVEGSWLNRVGREIARTWKRLMEIEGSPHAIAGGLAVGMFFGVTPLYGLKTLLTLGTSTVLRFNPIAAVISLTAHDLLTPFIPVTLRIQYDIGFFLMSHPHHLPPKIEMTSLHPEQLMHWTTFFHAGLPLLLGSLVVAIPSTITIYFVGLWYFTARRERKLGRAAATEQTEQTGQ
jgi:uncharacterized protein (DUF2062 family)